MTPLPLHPMLVHLPLALAILMPFLAGGLFFAVAQGWLPRRAWLILIAAQSVLLLSGVLSQRTGEEDEELAERVVPEAAIEAHEEAAEVFLWGAGIALVISLAGLLPGGGRLRWMTGAGALLATVGVGVLALRVGEAGGELVYKHGAATAHVEAAPASRWFGHEEDDDD